MARGSGAPPGWRPTVKGKSSAPDASQREKSFERNEDDD